MWIPDRLCAGVKLILNCFLLNDIFGPRISISFNMLRHHFRMIFRFCAYDGAFAFGVRVEDTPILLFSRKYPLYSPADPIAESVNNVADHILAVIDKHLNAEPVEDHPQFQLSIHTVHLAATADG